MCSNSSRQPVFDKKQKHWVKMQGYYISMVTFLFKKKIIDFGIALHPQFSRSPASTNGAGKMGRLATRRKNKVKKNKTCTKPLYYLSKCWNK